MTPTTTLENMKLIPPNHVWGPHFWYVIHIVAFTYPQNPNDIQKLAYRNFFESFANVLPCQKCKEHYKTHLNKHPIGPFLDSHTTLNQWVIDLHNLANYYLNKPKYSYDAVYNLYSNFQPPSPFNFYQQQVEHYKETQKQNNKLYSLIIPVIVLLFIAIIIYKLEYNQYWQY
jgi:hypothetical protein